MIVGPKSNIKILIIERFVFFWVARTTGQLVVPGKSVEANEATFQPSKKAKFVRAPLKSKELCVPGSVPEATAPARLKGLQNRVQREKESRFPCVQHKNQNQ